MKTIFVIILFTISVYSQNVWERVYELNPSRGIKEIVCVDSSKLYIGTTYGHIFYSSDKGFNWEQIAYQRNGDYPLKGISIPDTNNLFIVYDRLFLNKSTDAGKNFDTINLPDVYYGLNSGINMYDDKIGILQNGYLGFTLDGWETLDSLGFGNEFYTASDIEFLNDSIVYLFFADLYSWENFSPYNLTINMFDKANFGTFNLRTKKLKKISKIRLENGDAVGADDLIIRKEKIYLIGSHSYHSGFKYTNMVLMSEDGGQSWKSLLDVFFDIEFNGENYYNPTNLMGLSFKNDSVAIAVGQFGKILYTYDACNSWYLEMEKHLDLDGRSTMFINYETGEAILGVSNDYILRLKEDNLAPQPQDTFNISGYIFNGGNPQRNIPVALDNRITMTDDNGFYEFTRVRGRSFELKVLNKYYEYTPFLYEPKLVNITITKDTVINFNALDQREYYNFSGNVVDSDLNGLANIGVELVEKTTASYKRRDTTYTNEDGLYLFENKENLRYDIIPFSDKYTFIPEKMVYDLFEDINTEHYFKASPTSSVKEHPNFQLRNNVLISEEVAGMNYRVIALSGRVVKSGILPKELNLNAEHTGTYILHITKGEQVIYSHKFQVVR